MGEKESRKISQLEKEKLKEVETSLHLSGSILTPYGDLQSKQENTRATKHLGLCGKCRYLHYAEGEYGSVYAQCSYNDCRLSGNERINHCSMFKDVSHMDLDTALNLAWLIDDSKKERIGF